MMVPIPRAACCRRLMASARSARRARCRRRQHHRARRREAVPLPEGGEGPRLPLRPRRHPRPRRGSAPRTPAPLRRGRSPHLSPHLAPTFRGCGREKWGSGAGIVVEGANGPRWAQQNRARGPVAHQRRGNRRGLVADGAGRAAGGGASQPDDRAKRLRRGSSPLVAAASTRRDARLNTKVRCADWAAPQHEPRLGKRLRRPAQLLARQEQRAGRQQQPDRQLHRIDRVDEIEGLEESRTARRSRASTRA